MRYARMFSIMFCRLFLRHIESLLIPGLHWGMRQILGVGHFRSIHPSHRQRHEVRAGDTQSRNHTGALGDRRPGVDRGDERSSVQVSRRGDHVVWIERKIWTRAFRRKRPTCLKYVFYQAATVSVLWDESLRIVHLIMYKLKSCKITRSKFCFIFFVFTLSCYDYGSENICVLFFSVDVGTSVAFYHQQVFKIYVCERHRNPLT